MLPAQSPVLTFILLPVLAGSGRGNFTDARGPLAAFNNPTSMAVLYGASEEEDVLVVADTGNNVLRGVRIVDGETITLAGTGVAGTSTPCMRLCTHFETSGTERVGCRTELMEPHIVLTERDVVLA